MNYTNKIKEIDKILKWCIKNIDTYSSRQGIAKLYVESIEHNGSKDAYIRKVERILNENINNPFLANSLGYKIQSAPISDSKRRNKIIILEGKHEKEELNSEQVNAIMDILSLAEVSNNFHYKKDLPDLRNFLVSRFNLEDEDFEVYVGHNNRTNNDELEKLLFIKDAIRGKSEIQFSLEFNEENDNNNKNSLKALTDEKNGIGLKTEYQMFPISIIHDSDETFVKFIKDSVDTFSERRQSSFVNLSNIIHGSNKYNMKMLDQGKKQPVHELSKLDYTIPTRKSLKMKVSTKVGYKLRTRQSNYQILKDTPDYMELKFSEIYHGLNFMFMHDGPTNLFGSFIDDDINIEAKKEWDKKINKIR